MKKKPIYKVKIKWYYAILCGFCAILDGLTMILTLGHWSTDLQLRIALVGARKSWCVVTPIEDDPENFAALRGTALFPDRKPIDYIGKVDRFHVDGDGGMYDDFGTGLGGQPAKKEKRFCKGCWADVTETMYCTCGDFQLLRSETFSEKELEEMERKIALRDNPEK